LIGDSKYAIPGNFSVVAPAAVLEYFFVIEG
jgi:hypothetical protein